MMTRSKYEDMDAITIIGIFIAIAVAIPILGAFHGFVVSTLWNWFVPTITGWPYITFLQGWGLALLVGYISYKRTPDTSDTDKRSGAVKIAAGFAPALLALFFGWLIHDVLMTWR